VTPVKPETPSEEPKAESAAPRRRAGRMVMALGVWSLAVGCVLFLALRHGSFGLRLRRNAGATSTIAGVLATLSDASAANCPPVSNATAVDQALERAAKYNPPLVKPHLSDGRAALEIKSDDHCLGANDAQVTLMLFGDLECPFTRREVQMLRQWLDEQPGAFRWVWRERPLDVHPLAGKAALIAERLALRSGEPAFWRFVMAASELSEPPSQDDLTALDIGLQPAKPRLSDALATEEAVSKLERDRLIALSYAIHATPTLFVNGLRIEGEVSRAHLEQIIEEEKQEVQSLIDDAVPAAQTYSIRVDANLLDLERE
jgi:protein-disulfide isomerase